MKNVRFLDEAREEFLAEVAYYEEVQRGLGERFRVAVEAAVSPAATSPYLGSPWKFKTRRIFPRGFPFSLVYRIEPTGVVILAVAHFSRTPAYWRRRRDGV